MVLFLCINALLDILIHLVMIVNFQTAKMAGLNIGIIVCLWQMTPFAIAVSEYLLFGTKITVK